MTRTRALLMAIVGLSTMVGGCVPFFFGSVPAPIPVPPWTAERIEKRMCDPERTPVMPPILPGAAPVFCMDPPSEAEIIDALPHVIRGVPFICEEFRDNFTFVVEKIVDQIDPCTYVPLLGPAQLHHCHYKCIAYYTETLQSAYPFPYKCVKDRVQVVYIDKDHFHLCVGPDQKKQREIFRNLSGP